MPTREAFKACRDALEALRPDDVSALSSPALDKLLQEIAEGDPSRALRAGTGEINPHAPLQLILQDIVAFASVVYTVYDVAGKVNDFTNFALDENQQAEAVEKTIEKLRKVGLTYPADYLQSILNEYLDYITRPPSKNG
jgi:hypothetical protein